MNEEELLSKLVVENLSEPYKSYAKIIGIDNLYKLAKSKGGQNIHIPKPERLFKEYIYQQVINEYSQGNITMRALSQKYEIALVTVNNLIQKASKKI